MKTSISDNDKYPVVCEAAANDESVFSVFKTIPAYTWILEHVSPDLGRSYLDFILEEYERDDVVEMCKDAIVNDKFGGSQPILYDIGNEKINITPSTLRYTKVFIDLLSHFEDISEMNVCEIGGGYGGQCLVAESLSGFKSWDIVDLKEANKLQQKYLDKNEVSDVRFISLETITELKDEYDLVISNYAFSECTREIQDIYVDKILKKSKHGYMTMNFITHYEDLHSFETLSAVIDNIKDLEEKPNSFDTNRVYVW
jgi:hypothetical protein